MGFHYTHNASGAHRWVHCSVAKALEAEVPARPAGEAAVTGTASHFLGEWALTYHIDVDDKLIGSAVCFNGDDAEKIVVGPDSNLYIGTERHPFPSKAADKTVVVDEQMVRGVSLYVNTVRQIMAKYPGCKLHIEQNYKLAPDMGGFCDCTIVTPNRLIVIDYKNGRGYVDAVDNYQLAMYGVGALGAYSANLQIKDVVMAIVQPNVSGPPVRTWTQSVTQMNAWRDRFENARFKSRKAIAERKAGKDISGYCNPGSYCKWCPGAIACPAMQKKAQSIVRQIPDLPSNNLPAPTSLTDERLLWVAKHGDSIVDFVEQCREHMTAEAAKGKQWPGYKLVEKPTRRKLVDKDVLMQKLKDQGHMQAFEAKLKALSKLEKILDEETWEPFIEKPAGTLELVPNSDKRSSAKETMLAQLSELGGK